MITPLRSLHRGYVWFMPVSTEPARALGELWAYPRVVGDVEIVRGPERVETDVRIDGRHLLTLTAAPPRGVSVSAHGSTLTSSDGDVIQTPAAFDGTAGL